MHTPIFHLFRGKKSPQGNGWWLSGDRCGECAPTRFLAPSVSKFQWISSQDVFQDFHVFSLSCKLASFIKREAVIGHHSWQLHSASLFAFFCEEENHIKMNSQVKLLQRSPLFHHRCPWGPLGSCHKRICSSGMGFSWPGKQARKTKLTTQQVAFSLPNQNAFPKVKSVYSIPTP